MKTDDLSKEEWELFDILKKKILMPDGSADMDSVIGLMLDLMEEKGVKKMLSFLKATPNVTRDDVYDFFDVM